MELEQPPAAFTVSDSVVWLLKLLLVPVTVKVSVPVAVVLLVLMFRVTDCELVPLIVTEFELREQVTPDRQLVLKLTAPVNPPEGVTVIVELVPCPWVTLAVEGLDDRLMAALPPPPEAPVPLRLAVWVPALSMTVSVPVRVPVADGVNVTLIVHLAAGDRFPPQLLVSAKSPVTATLLIVRVADPVLVSVAGCAPLVLPTFVLVKVREAGATLAEFVTPVPDRAAVWGLPVALSLTVKVAVLLPTAAGVNVTLIVQLAPAARLEPQVWVCAKSPLSVPLIAMLLMLTEEAVPLLKVSACAALLMPTI